MSGIGNAIIGTSQGMSLVDQRNQKLQQLQMQQEQHNLQMQQGQQKIDATQLAIEQAQMQIDQTRKEISKRDMFEAMKVATKQNDATLLKRWILKDPEAQDVFDNPVDFKVASKVDDLDGIEDEILLESGFDENALLKMSKEDKIKAIKEFGDDTYIITKADGSKEVLQLDELAASTGFLDYLSEQDKAEYTKAVVAGGLRRAYALAIYKGDEELAKKYKEALNETQATRQPVPTATYRNARTKVLAKNPELENDPKALEQAIGQQMLEDENPAFVKKTEYNLSALEDAKSIYDEVSAAKDPETAQALIRTKPAQKAYMLENDLLKKDPTWNKVVPVIDERMQAVQTFTPIIEQVASGNVKSLDAIDKALNAIFSKVPNDSIKDMDIKKAMQPGEMDKLNYEMQQYVAQMNLSNQAQLAMFSLVKAMSGLAVTDKEREVYTTLLGQNKLDDLHKAFIAAQSFVQHQGTILDGVIDRLSAHYPMHAATYKAQLKPIMTAADPATYTNNKEPKVIDTKKIISEINAATQAAIKGAF